MENLHGIWRKFSIPTIQRTWTEASLSGILEEKIFRKLLFQKIVPHTIIESWQIEYMASLRGKELSGTYKVNVVPPSDDNTNYRLSMAVYPSMEEAERNINRFRKEFNDETIWILAY